METLTPLEAELLATITELRKVLRSLTWASEAQREALPPIALYAIEIALNKADAAIKKGEAFPAKTLAEVDFFPKAQARKDAVTAHVLRTQISELDRKVAELKAENTDLAFSNGHLEGALTTMTQDRDSLKAQAAEDAEAVRLFHCIKSWIQVTPSSK